VLRHTYDNQICSVARALELIGERWTLLIVRDALLGATRFDAFLASLGLARNVLTDRLNSLVEHGIFERVPYQQRPLRHDYRLTPMGRDLVGVVIPLMEWGDRYLAGEAGPPRVAQHRDCGGHVVSQFVCEQCSRPVPNNEVSNSPAGQHPAGLN
jgi:DNA-binding HxlR family transcriptional regulator